MDVLLIHGLGRTPASLFGLAARLRHAGHRTHFFGYSTTFESRERIVGRLSNKLKQFEDHPPFAIVAHSLGGILSRMAIPRVPGLKIHRLIMLGTPNQSPRLARRLWKRWLFRFWAGSCGRFLATPDEYTALLPPDYPYTVIAGTSGPTGRLSPFGNDINDAIVSVSECTLDPAHPPILFPAWHTTMMNNTDIQNRIVELLNTP